jgi:branched-chain amino acid transport system substrate-binding protein
MALLAAAAAGCGGSGGGDSERAGEIAFGVLAPLSGPEADRGRDLVDGAQLAVDDLNVRGGVIGRSLTLVAEDDGCSAGRGAAAARKLATTEQVAGVVGAVCDAAAGAAARALARGQVPFLVSSARSPDVVDPRATPSAYLLSGTPYQEALAAAHWLALRGVQRLAAVTDGAPASAFLVEKLTGIVTPTPRLLSRQTLGAGADAALVARTAIAANPDVVYWAGSADGAGRLVAALRAAGFDGTFLASAGAESPAFAGADAAEGAFVVAPARAQYLRGGAAWARRFEDAYGHEPGRDALRAYDAVRTLAQAITQTGEVQHARNTAQLRHLDLEFTTLLGPVQFALDHTIQEDDHLILVVRHGRFRTANALRSNGG